MFLRTWSMNTLVVNTWWRSSCQEKKLLKNDKFSSSFFIDASVYLITRGDYDYNCGNWKFLAEVILGREADFMMYNLIY